MWKILQTFDKISRTKGKSLRPQIEVEMLHFGGPIWFFFRVLNIASFAHWTLSSKISQKNRADFENKSYRFLGLKLGKNDQSWANSIFFQEIFH